VVFGALFLGANGTSPPKVRGFYAAAVASLIGAAYVSRVHSWSYLNDLMPAHAALALLFGLGIPTVRAEGSLTLQRAPGVVYLLAALQFSALWEDVRHFIPSANDHAEGEQMLAAIRALPGDVLVAEHPHLAVQAGKGSLAHEMAVIDVMRLEHDVRDARVLLRAAFQRAFQAHRFSAVMTDDPLILQGELLGSYRPAPAWFVHDRGAFIPRTGGPIRPLYLFVPR
jgi:hypothetical protein